MDANTLKLWVNGYRDAWVSNDAEEIGRLFADGARYYTEPYAEPWEGRDGIIAKWIRAGVDPVLRSASARVQQPVGGAPRRRRSLPGVRGVVDEAPEGRARRVIPPA
jgi:hypothetical protein